MILIRKKKDILRLLNSFGKIKDEYFNFELIEHYYRHKDHTEAFQTLTDKTCNDLDFRELFMFIDRTNSKIGQQLLYNRLRIIPDSFEKTEMHEALIRKLTNNADLRINIQRQLEKLNNDEAYYITSLFQDEHIKQPKWFFIVKILSFTGLLSLIMLSFNPQVVFVLLCVFIINAVIHLWNKRNLYRYLGSIPQLLRLNDIARNLCKNDFLKQLNPSLEGSIKVIDRVRNGMSFFKLESRLQGDLEALVWFFIELFKILFLLEPLLLFGVLKRLDTKRKEIENVFSFVGQIDTLISVASLRKGLTKYCSPEINNAENNFIAKEIYHPLIHNCIENNIAVQKKSILLTGSNMSGKTSFIRTIGINVITGLTINTCFAEKIIMPKTKIFSAIRISDDLINDKSYYFEEVLTIKDMIDNSENSHQHNIFLLDEIFKGTNTVERVSAGKAVLSSLAKKSNIVFVSTHDIELADLLKEEYELYHFSEIVNNNIVDFDYKLKPGKLKNRNAIRILEINNYPKNIISEAIEISKDMDQITLDSKQYQK